MRFRSVLTCAPGPADKIGLDEPYGPAAALLSEVIGRPEKDIWCDVSRTEADISEQRHNTKPMVPSARCLKSDGSSCDVFAANGSTTADRH